MKFHCNEQLARCSLLLPVSLAPRFPNASCSDSRSDTAGLPHVLVAARGVARSSAFYHAHIHSTNFKAKQAKALNKCPRARMVHKDRRDLAASRATTASSLQRTTIRMHGHEVPISKRAAPSKPPDNPTSPAPSMARQDRQQPVAPRPRGPLRRAPSTASDTTRTAPQTPSATHAK